MIKPLLMVRLLKQRLALHEARLKAAATATESNMFDMYLNPSYSQAVEEEVGFLRVVLEEVE